MKDSFKDGWPPLRRPAPPMPPPPAAPESRKPRFKLTTQKIKVAERDVVKQCLTFLALHGWVAHRLPVGKLKSPAGGWITLYPEGTPDYLCAHRAYPAFYLETKRPGEKATMAQTVTHNEKRIVWGLKTVVVDSVDQLAVWLIEQFPDRQPLLMKGHHDTGPVTADPISL